MTKSDPMETAKECLKQALMKHRMMLWLLQADDINKLWQQVTGAGSIAGWTVRTQGTTRSTEIGLVLS